MGTIHMAYRLLLAVLLPFEILLSGYIVPVVY